MQIIVTSKQGSVISVNSIQPRIHRHGTIVHFDKTWAFSVEIE